MQPSSKKPATFPQKAKPAAQTIAPAKESQRIVTAKKRAKMFPEESTTAKKTPQSTADALRKLGSEGHHKLPEIPSHADNDSDKTKKLMVTSDELIAKGIRELLQRDKVDD